MNMKAAKQIKLKKNMSVQELANEFEAAGVFQAGNLGKACGLWREMLATKTKVILAFAGAMVPGGLRSVISDCVKQGLVDAVVTTGASITHDLAIAFGEKYYQCPSNSDDAKLRKQGISRIYDVASPDKTSEGFEKEIQKIFKEIPEGTHAPSDIMRIVGSKIDDKESIVHQCAARSIPLFVPALEDSIFGIQLYIHSQDRKLQLNGLKDAGNIIDWCYDNKQRGIIILGGGVPKNFALQAALIPGPYSYAIQITTETPEAGGLSGATLSEAISWGKLSEKTKMASVHSDATIAFPLLVSAVL